MIRRCPQHGYYRGELCGCGSAGQLLLDDARTEHLGRLLAGCLRHFPGDLGLEMDSRGWVDLSDLCRVVRSRHRWARRELLMALLETDPKHRYEIANGRVRARYGHSVDVELDHPESDHPELYYGASEEEADRILEVGLKSASQRYVHLSTTPEKAWFVATFRTSNPRVIRADAAAARRAGVKMMAVNEEIVISEQIPPGFLSILSSREFQRPERA
ncbi:MAG: RNA 2'-phosphotransferase [Methanothrix sp.]|nr:RNA 2'-phosphotransferase [Methanothrix sp.]